MQYPNPTRWLKVGDRVRRRNGHGVARRVSGTVRAVGVDEARVRWDEPVFTRIGYSCRETVKLRHLELLLPVNGEAAFDAEMDRAITSGGQVWDGEHWVAGHAFSRVWDGRV